MRSRSDRGHLMVVKSVRVVYCDQCGTDGGTERYMIAFPGGGRRSFDLCEQCAGPLRELAGLLEKVGERGPKHHQQPVLSEDQIAARVKRSQKPGKKADSRSSRAV